MLLQKIKTWLGIHKHEFTGEITIMHGMEMQRCFFPGCNCYDLTERQHRYDEDRHNKLIEGAEIALERHRMASKFNTELKLAYNEFMNGARTPEDLAKYNKVVEEWKAWKEQDELLKHI